MNRNTHIWKRIELHFIAGNKVNNPYIDMKMMVKFISPNGKTYDAQGFWDGGQEWKVRFAPNEIGQWSWRSSSEDQGLHGNEGTFDVDPYEGEQALYKHGFIRVHESNRAFAHEDGEPFFWLADTVWSISSHARLEEWQEFVDHRSKQGFNVMQTTSLPQWDASDADFRKPFAMNPEGGYDVLEPNINYFKYLDSLFEISAKAGLIHAVVVLWFNYVPRNNMGWSFDLDRSTQFDAELARIYSEYLTSRYAAFGTVWLVSGDTDLTGDVIGIYDAAAEGILTASPYKPLRTAHMVGEMAAPDFLNERERLDYHMLQSGHSYKSTDNALRIIQKDRDYAPTRPVINGEPCYEFIIKGDEKEEKHKLATREFVRSVEWSSVLGGANAGITFGSHAIWPWHREEQSYEMGWLYGQPRSWKEGLRSEAGADISRLKEFMSRLPWWDLQPRDGITNKTRDVSMVASETTDGSTLLIYVREPDIVHVAVLTGVKYEGTWYDPETHETMDARIEFSSSEVIIDPYPWTHDAILKLQMI